MAFSKIVLTFNRRVEIGENLFFNWRDLDVDGGATSFITNEVWAAARTRPGLVEYQLEVNNGQFDRLNYIDAFNYDYNGGNLFTVVASGGFEVTITAKKNNIEFLNFSSSGGVTAIITNEAQVPTFFIDSITYEEAASDKCTNVQVRIACTDIPTELVNPVVAHIIAGNDVLFDYPRGTNILAIVTNGVSSPSQSFTTPFFLNLPIVKVVQTPTGATATFTQQTTLTTQYSLDGITYQNSTTFFGLAAGNFTGYVKDNFGCVKTTAFVVDEFTQDVTTTIPSAYVSNSNSIRFKKDEVFDNNSIFRNDLNTLSSEEKAILCVPFIHKFTDQDVIKTQFKTNYETAEVSVFNCASGITDNPTIIPVTDNLNKIDKRDAIGYTFLDDSNRYGFYFQTGNTYEDDFPVNTISGEYQLFGAIPNWCKIGAFFSVDNGAYSEIIDIVFVDDLQAYVIVSSVAYVGVTFILRAQYNVFNWDAFEFEIDMSAYLNGEIQVTISLTDSKVDYEDVTFISEKVQIYSDLSDLITIKSRNTTNNDVIYATGIEHLSRIDFDLYGLADESELEVEKGDDTVYQLNSYSYAKKKLSLTRLSTMVARSVRQQLSLNDVVIDGIDCKVEEIGEPTRIGVTNMYKMEIVLYQVENKLTATDVDTDIELDILDVPALVQGDDEFIKYE